MFEAAHKILPPADYASLIRSLYADRRSMLLGAYGSALATSVAALEAEAPILWVFTAIFFIVGTLRNLDMRQFDRITLDDQDVAQAMYWEMRATYGAAAIALTYGAWCLVSFWLVDDSFAELTAAAVSVSVLVGVSQRNFAVDRLMVIQVLLIAVPLGMGLVLTGNLYYSLLTLLLLPFFISLRTIARSSREMLLRAVRGRVAATSLASQLDTALATLEHGLLMLDAQGHIEVSNGRALDAFELPETQSWVGRPVRELLGNALNRGGIERPAHDQLNNLIRAHRSGKLVFSSRPGKHYEVSVSSRHDKTVLLFEDISERITAEERISYMARYDMLTGLPNRAYFVEQVEAILAKRRSAGRPHYAGLWMIDIDDFKHINDTMGHLAGDHVLSQVAHRLNDAFGKGAIVARLGGDEFIAYFADGADQAELLAKTNVVLAAIRQELLIEGRTLVIDASIGTVVSDDNSETLEQLMVKADLAISSAKSNGKSQAVQFHDRMDTEYHMRQQLKIDLKDAVASGGLSLVYQALINPHNNSVVGCEALARWKHSVYGEISPAIFVPLAEENGLITDLTRAVLAMATRDCQSWPGESTVAVNISAKDFRATDVENMVMEALEASGLPPTRLELEVTESAVIDERDAATAALSKLRARGIGVALDDFGTGYSSLSYLQALPLTKLKIDRSFVLEIETDPRALKFVANVAQLGKDLDLAIVVEGVESKDQLNLLVQQTRVDQIQGFVYGAPMNAEAMARLLKSRQPMVKGSVHKLLTPLA
jgi:diguanylate cyclase (GGDEF)-like protein